MTAEIKTEAKLTIRLDKELHEKLKEKAKELRLTQSAIIRLALLQFLEGSRGAPCVAAAEGGEPTVSR